MESTLVVIDVQKEYVTAGRPFYIQSIDQSLENGKRILDHARNEGWNIVHVRHEQEGDLFGKGTDLAGFVKGFEPREGEHEIIKGNFSCFSSPDFCSKIEKYKDQELVVIGYGTTMCCLSTIIEGYHRGFKMKIVSDATRAKAKSFAEEETHQYAVDTLSTFCEVVDTCQLIES